MELRPCVLCGVFSAGFPEKTLGGGLSSYGKPDSWVYRMDLNGWTCLDCNEKMGQDKVRESLRKEKSNE